MNNKICRVCGSSMKRNGLTSSGAQRWRCVRCGASAVHTYDTETKELKRFLEWLLTKERQLKASP